MRVVPTWDAGQVLQFLSQWHPASGITLHELTWKVVFLLVVCTAKRVNDLLLFSVHSSLCHVGNTSIVLQTAFGSKTDRPSHRAPPVKLKQCVEESLGVGVDARLGPSMSVVELVHTVYLRACGILPF